MLFRNLSRRDILSRSVGLAGTTTFAMAAVPHKNASGLRRVSQDELVSAIQQHALWYDDPSKGKRASFSDCDLSGLHFPDHGEEGFFNVESLDFLNLAGADFTNADLSYATGGNVSFKRCSLQNARLSFSTFLSPGFIGATLRQAKCDHVRWGSAEIHEPLDVAALMHVDAGRSDFSNARIHGYFYCSAFVGALMKGVDFSRSVFSGPESRIDYTSFYLADLTQAKFNQTDLRSVRFARANLEGADFSSSTMAGEVRASLLETHREVHFQNPKV